MSQEVGSVLVYCLPKDHHVHCVSWALKKYGVNCYQWHPGDLPDYQHASAKIIDGKFSFEFQTKNETKYTSNNVKAIWNRRYPHTVAPSYLSPKDRAVSENQSFLFIQNIRFSISKNVFTVNDPSSEFLASKKLMQLRIANDVGFNIPDTLISNCPDATQEFWDRYEGNIIVKPMVNVAWKREKRIFSFLATDMPEPRSIDYRSIESSPSIYQKKIDKLYDIRLLYIDGYIASISINPTDSDKIDIRESMANRSVYYSMIDTPFDVRNMVIEYAKRMDIVFGAFDFGVDKNGEWTFFECNCSGQFLWLEEAIPETLFLSRFSHMLARRVIPGLALDEDIFLRDCIATEEFSQLSVDGVSNHKPGIMINPILSDS